jgi:signal transduction histidine kinase
MAAPSARPVRRVDRDVQAIGAVTQAILDGDDLEQLLGRIALEARVLADAVSGVVVTVAGSPGVMTFRAIDGRSLGPLRVGHVMPVRDTLTELALIRGTNIVARNAIEIPPAGRAFAEATGTGPLIAAPLAPIGSARGVVVVARIVDAPAFAPADVSLVSTFAAQAASAIELFELRAAQSTQAVRAERERIGTELHEGVVRALRDLQAGVVGLATGTTDRQLAAGIDGAASQLDAAIKTMTEYVAELASEPAPAPADAHTPSRHTSRQPAAAPRSTLKPRTKGAAGPARGGHRTIAVMGDLARAAVANASTDEVLQSLIDAILERSAAGLALIGTLTDDGSEVRVRAISGADVPGRRVGDTIPIAETVAGEAIRLGRPIVVRSNRDASSSIPAAVKEIVGPVVAVPLVVRDRRFGAMAIGRPVGAEPFKTSEVALIEAYGVQAAIALEFERVRAGLRAGSVSIERDRIGRDLHEHVIQLLFGVAFSLEALASTVGEQAVRTSLQAAVEALDRTIRDLRRFVFGLGPGPGPEPRHDDQMEALAADNARLNAQVETQLREVRASRARIVAAGDAERKRVERDLHDGAQQRLVSLTLALRLARTRLGDDLDPAARVSLDQASAEAKAALSELRELARGIHPQILTEAGLGPAVESLAARSPLSVAVEVEPRRFPSVVEGAAYFTISEALTNVAKYANADQALVRADWQDGELRVEIVDDGVGGADPSTGSGLRGLADRLEAVNGSLEIRSPLGGGTRLVARIPVLAGAGAS